LTNCPRHAARQNEDLQVPYSTHAPSLPVRPQELLNTCPSVQVLTAQLVIRALPSPATRALRAARPGARRRLQSAARRKPALIGESPVTRQGRAGTQSHPPRGRGRGRDTTTDPAADPFCGHRRLPPCWCGFRNPDRGTNGVGCLLTKRSSSRCSSKCASCTDWRTKPHASEQGSTHMCKRVCVGMTETHRFFRQRSVTWPMRLSRRFPNPACRAHSQNSFTERSSANLVADNPLNARAPC